MSISDILGWFPNLDSQSLAITSPITPVYNCIAYAAGDQRRWWWPDAQGTFYWPDGVQRAERLAAFQAAFESLGFELTADESHDPNLEKIAIFALNGVPTHAAIQLADGRWSSKLGRREDIAHDLRGIEGPRYGQIAFFMQRPRVSP